MTIWCKPVIEESIFIKLSLDQDLHSFKNKKSGYHTVDKLNSLTMDHHHDAQDK